MGTVQSPVINLQNNQRQSFNRTESQKQNSLRRTNSPGPYRQDKEQPLESQAQRHPQGPQCLRCDGNGHIANYCPTLTCYTCQGEGHVAKNCNPPERQPLLQMR